MQNLLAALQSIRQADGYHYNVEALAVKLDANHEVEDVVAAAGTPARPLIVLELDPNTFEHFPSEQIRLRMPFTVHAANDAELESDASRMETFFKLAADVETAVAQDITRGGDAHETRLLERSISEYDGREVWAAISGEIRVHRTYGDPNA